MQWNGELFRCSERWFHDCSSCMLKAAGCPIDKLFDHVCYPCHNYHNCTGPCFSRCFPCSELPELRSVLPCYPHVLPGQEAIGASRVPELHGGPEGQYLRESTGRWRLGAGGHNLRWCLGMFFWDVMNGIYINIQYIFG